MEATQKPSVLEARKRIDFAKELAEKGWYHSFELPDGSRIDGFMSLEHERMRYARFPIPDDLRGKKVLDIGAWDGWFSFEAERHGATVTAVDCVEMRSFLEVKRRLNSQVDYRTMDVYEMPDAGLGTFDIVFFLGIVYHVRHPLLALDILCGLTRDIAIVDSFVTDGSTWQDNPEEIPTMEFYELEELGNQFGNWFGPSVACLVAMCRAAGFVRVELLFAAAHHAVAACYRNWEPIPSNASAAPPELFAVVNSRTYGVNFWTRKSEEYITCLFRTTRPSVTPADLCLEVDGLGVPALLVNREPNGAWNASFRLPSGISKGWHMVRLRFPDSQFAPEFRIVVDVLPVAEHITLDAVCDGITWARGEVNLANQGVISCWADGLPENADLFNVRGFLGDTRLETAYVGPADDRGFRQVNLTVPGDVLVEEHPFRIECAGVSSEPRTVKVIHQA